ncbi:unnamed protein product [Brassica rapa]|uniref:Uncharacterized protein n=2 Tax=Brassica TaxID=3705 RepID=A0A8D9GZK2_BRACM|nr:unnamed protein product [Brassica napus]CAG7889993.1 unnamed protein product [Brassica rapa]
MDEKVRHEFLRGNIKNITIMMYRDCRVHCEETFSFSLKLLH